MIFKIKLITTENQLKSGDRFIFSPTDLISLQYFKDDLSSGMTALAFKMCLSRFLKGKNPGNFRMDFAVIDQGTDLPELSGIGLDKNMRLEFVEGILTPCFRAAQG